MKNSILKLCFLSMAAALVFAWSCSKSDPVSTPGDEPVPSRFVSGVVLEKEYNVAKGDVISLTGKGFAAGDYLLLRTGSDIRVTPSEVADNKFSFAVPDAVETGTTYRFVLRRANMMQALGSAKINVISGSGDDFPDKEGATIKGRVVCAGEPVEGVLVSDGVKIEKTDEMGRYWIESKKKHGSVFVILPSGYNVATKEALPQFWQKLVKAAGGLEQQDFELFRVDNDRHVMVVATDMHLANRSTGDLSQFTAGFVSEMTAMCNAESAPVYCLNLGDLSWDLYWYQNRFSLADAKACVKGVDFQFWSTMGNHDNDAAYQGDWEPEQTYRDEMGPVFYSMNIGKVHYIMLDNTVYKNDGEPGHSTIAGSRNYDKYFSQDNIAFLKEDLKHVDKSTPIFVGYHCPIRTMAYNAANGWYVNDAISLSRQKELLECFEGYSDVTLLSGHSHVNRNIPIEGYAAKMIEQNVAAVCGTWWWTYRYAQNNACCDGSPAGYKVFTADGDKVTYKYKGMGVDIDRQFQTYDMNEFMKYWNSDATAKFKEKMPERAGDYADLSPTSNVVYINVWAWEPAWKIEVTENGRQLEVEQIRKYDPLRMASYDIPRGATTSLTFPSEYTCHMFAVEAASATSTLEVKVTDTFGVVYAESMTRPKAFTTQYE